MPVLSSDLVRRKKEYVFVEGYFVDCANELTGAIDATQEVIHIYGQDDPILDINVNSSTLTLTAYDKKDNNVLLDALQRIDPDDTSIKMYNWENIYPTTVWANRMNTTNTQYTRSVFYKNWLPVPGLATGDPNAKGTRSLAGNSEPALEFSEPIFGEKINLVSGSSPAKNYAGTITHTPLAIPGSNPTKYAIRVVAIRDLRTFGTNNITTYEEEEMTIDSSMVANDKSVTIDFTDMNILDGPSHAYVNYLYSKDVGVYPTITPSGKFFSGSGVV